METALEPVGGIADIWALWRSGKIAEAMKLWDAIQAKDITLIAAEIGVVLAMFGQSEYGPEVNALAASIKSGDAVAITKHAAVLVQLVADEFAKSPPVGPIRMMAVGAIDEERLAKIISVLRAAIPILTVVGSDQDTAETLYETSKRTEKFTNMEAKTWLADNRSNVRAGAHRYSVRLALRNAPEVLSAMAGDAPPVVGGFVPYLIPVVIVLKMIVARYDSNHPNGVTAVGAPADLGLSLDDLAS